MKPGAARLRKLFDMLPRMQRADAVELHTLLLAIVDGKDVHDYLGVEKPRRKDPRAKPGGYYLWMTIDYLRLRQLEPRRKELSARTEIAERWGISASRVLAVIHKSDAVSRVAKGIIVSNNLSRNGKQLIAAIESKRGLYSK